MPKPFQDGLLFSLSIFACKEENIKIFTFRIHEISNTDEKTFEKETK